MKEIVLSKMQKAPGKIGEYKGANLDIRNNDAELTVDTTYHWRILYQHKPETDEENQITKIV